MRLTRWDCGCPARKEEARLGVCRLAAGRCVFLDARIPTPLERINALTPGIYIVPPSLVFVSGK